MSTRDLAPRLISDQTESALLPSDISELLLKSYM